MYENGWCYLYFYKTSELFSDRFGIIHRSDIPNPFSAGFTNEATEKEIEHVHPSTKEPFIYQLYEYKFGDYLLRYLKAEMDEEDGEYTAVWRKVEPCV